MTTWDHRLAERRVTAGPTSGLRTDRLFIEVGDVLLPMHGRVMVVAEAMLPLCGS